MNKNIFLILCALPAFFAGCASYRPTLAVDSLPAANYNLAKNTKVSNSETVRSGDGVWVKGLDEWEGEISGIAKPESKFSKLQIGLREDDVVKFLGKADDRTFRISGKAFIPLYMGSGRSNVETIYNGQGRLIYSRGGGSDHHMYLTWIIHNENEFYSPAKDAKQ